MALVKKNSLYEIFMKYRQNEIINQYSEHYSNCLGSLDQLISWTHHENRGDLDHKNTTIVQIK